MASAGVRRRWFGGDRTLEQQMKGLGPALSGARGMSVLDLGCAEGLIAAEFAKAGGKVTAVEIVPEMAKEAREHCAGRPVEIVCQDVEKFIAEHYALAADGKYECDIVLALAILHKLKSPDTAAEFVGMVTRRFAVVRLPASTPGYVQDERTGRRKFDITAILHRRGLALDRVERGHFDEWCGYFRRVR